MVSWGELGDLVAALETEVRLARQDAAGDGAANRDVEALSAEVDVLKATLRTMEVEEGQNFEKSNDLRRRLIDLEIDTRGGFAMLIAGQAEILSLVHRLIDRRGGRERIARERSGPRT